MFGKAYDYAAVMFVTCKYQKACFHLEYCWSASAALSPAKGLVARTAGIKAAIARLGHQPGIGDNSGESTAARSRSGIIHTRPASWRENGKLLSAQHGRKGQRIVPTIPCEIVARAGSASRVNVTIIASRTAPMAVSSPAS